MGDQDVASPGRSVSCGLQVCCEPYFVVLKEDPAGDLPATLTF